MNDSRGLFVSLSNSLVNAGELFVFDSNLNGIILYHWTLNVEELKKNGFRDHQSRHKAEVDNVWFVDQLMGDSSSIKPGMRLVTIDMSDKEVEPYEEVNEGSGYRAFRIPANIANQYVLKFPTVYNDRGVYKINP